MKKKILLVLLVLFVGVIQADASVLVTGVTIEDVSSEWNSATYYQAVAEKLLGSGLDINGAGTHSTVWAGLYTAGDNGSMWACASGDSDVYVIFDLGQVYADLDSIKIWNFNRPGHTIDQAAKDIDIYVSDTSLSFGNAGWTLDSQVVLTEAPGDDVTSFGDEFAITTSNVRYVLLDLKTQLDGDSAGYLMGLSEVAFYNVPEPATLVLLGMGLIGLARRSK